MKNLRIRQLAASKGVKLWEVAQMLGVADATLSRKLRVEIPENEQTRIIGIIERIAAEREVIV